MLSGVWLLVFEFSPALAFPPAPHHSLQGLVRDRWGDPLDVTSARVILETADGLHGGGASLVPGIVPGGNFQMEVAMDTGVTSRLYKPTALRPSLPFTLKVQVGQTTYVPMQMICSNYTIGLPAETSWIDLTLGVDSDCDGLPDAWEQQIIARIGGTLESITPDGDVDGDGLSNRNEYQAGTYAFDPDDGFALTLLELDDAKTTLEFLAVRGRTYSIQMSTDLNEWIPVTFRAVNSETPGVLQNNYLSTASQFLKVEIPNLAVDETKRFFKALVH